MAPDKVGWALADGLKARRNLLIMVQLVLDRLVAEEKLRKYQNTTNGDYWTLFNYNIVGIEDETDVIFDIDDVALYFRVKDAAGKYEKLENYKREWNCYKVVRKFDFTKEHFFPLGVLEQENALRKFIEDAISDICVQKLPVT